MEYTSLIDHDGGSAMRSEDDNHIWAFLRKVVHQMLVEFGRDHLRAPQMCDTHKRQVVLTTTCRRDPCVILGFKTLNLAF